jgi:hypothetical protein
MRSKALLAALAAASMTGTVFAQTTFGAGATAAPWVKLAASARVAALADAGSGLAGDIDAQNLNPASLAGLKGQQFTLMHNIYVADSSVEHAAYGLGLMESSGLAISADYVNFGSVDKYQVVNNALVADGSLNPNAWTATLGYGMKLGSIALGANGKMISQDLGGSSGSAFAGDLGAQWGFSAKDASITLAAAYQNIGTALNGASLPQGLRLGAAASTAVGLGQLSLLGDFSALEAESSFGTGSVGLELMGTSLYALRGGYKFLSNGGAGGFTVGGGLRFSAFSVDYAFASRDGIGAANQISVGGHF